VTVVRVDDDVVKTALTPQVSPGDVVTYEIVVQPNVTPVDLTYTITDTPPPGFTILTAAATSGFVSIVGNQLHWTGVMPAAEPTYLVATSATDPACAAPLAAADGVADSYTNLEAFGILTDPGISGDTVWFTVDFSGGEFEFFGSDQGENINFTDDGFAFFDPSAPGGTPWVHQPIPTASDPNNLMAMFWRDMEIVYDGATNRGVSLANLSSGGNPVAGIIEYDNAEDWPPGANPTYERVRVHLRLRQPDGTRHDRDHRSGECRRNRRRAICLRQHRGDRRDGGLLRLRDPGGYAGRDHLHGLGRPGRRRGCLHEQRRPLHG
jgi:uncharacterized repeat protein (TIGR01451 family)